MEMIRNNRILYIFDEFDSLLQTVHLLYMFLLLLISRYVIYKEIRTSEAAVTRDQSKTRFKC